MAQPSANLEIALGGTPNFSNASYGDLMVYTVSKAQNIHLGVDRGSNSEVKISKSNVTVSGGFTSTGGVATTTVSLGGSVLGLVSASNAMSNVYFNNNIGISDVNLLQSNLDAKLDKSGGVIQNDLTINGNLSVAGSIGQPSGFMFRNKIINGDMRINQRGGPWNLISNTYLVDRFKYTGGYTTFNISQDSDVPAGQLFSNSVKILVASPTATDSYAWISQIIEGYNASDLMWGTSFAKSVTLSFWVKSTVAGVYAISVWSGPTSNRMYYATTYTISSANTWTYVSIVVPGPTTGTWTPDNTSCIEVAFDVGATIFSGTSYTTSTTNTWVGTGSANQACFSTNRTVLLKNQAANSALWITGLQLERGNVATPFEFRPYGVELQLCQRYFERRNFAQYETVLVCLADGYNTNTNIIGCIPYSVPKRTGIVTVGFSNINIKKDASAYYTCSAVAAGGRNLLAASIAFTSGTQVAAGIPVGITSQNAAGGYLDFSCEF